MTRIKTVCVYCGASGRVDAVYKEAAVRLGQVLGHADLRMVYGGGQVGLMGIVAESALKNNVHVVGILPKILEDYEGAQAGLSELYIVDSMHTRKRRMSELSDAFIILPGGFGTLDELFEILTWRQLGMHNKPIIVVNVNGYWSALKSLVDQVVMENFATLEDSGYITFVESPDEIVNTLAYLNLKDASLKSLA